MAVPLDEQPQGGETSDRVLCGVCGAENPSTGQACSRCGSPLPTAVPPRPPWLSEAASPQPAAPSAGPLPTWLKAALPASSLPFSAAPPEWLHSRSAPEPPRAAPPAEEIPAWLQELEGPSAEVVGAEEIELFAPSTEPPRGDEALDWLSGLFAASPEAEAQPEEAAKAEEVEERPEAPPPLLATGRPEWLSIEEEAAPLEEIPPWLADLGEPTAGAPESAKAEPAAEVEVPEWLQELSTPALDASAPQEGMPLEEPPLAVTPAGGGEERAGWAEADLELELDKGLTVGEAAPSEERDLLGLSADLELLPAEEELALPTPVEGTELPEWLRGLHDLGAPPEVAEPTAEGEPGLLDQIRDLRYEAIVGAEEQPPRLGMEAVGALKDVAGVIQPELIFEGSALRIGEPTQELVISDRQAEQIALLRRTLARETQGVTAAPRQRWGVPLLRWLVALILIAATAVTLLLDITPFDPSLAGQSPAAGVSEAYRLLENLSRGESTVLVAFEYEADTAAELEPLAVTLLAHLAVQPATTVYTISTRPTGAAMADSALRQESIRLLLGERADTWINLGYLPARASGIYGLAIGATQAAPLPRLNKGEVDLIIVLAARSDDLRIWVEQVGRPTGIPVLAATSASVTALAQPYQDSGQVVAVLSGLNDAAAYQALGGRATHPALAGRWNAQALAGSVAAALIALGSVLYGMSHLRNRQGTTR